MFCVRVSLFTAAAVYCAAAFAPAATASTVRELPSVASEPLGEFSLADLLTEDALGDECITEDDIDLAFFASGKGMRLPRTCLPDPCNQALTPFRLAELIGRPAQTSEWDRYFSRYADACRKEVVSFDDDVAEEPVSRAEFWAPILGGRVVQGRLVRGENIFDRTARRFFFPRTGGSPRFGTPVSFGPGPSGGPTPPPPFGGDPEGDPETGGDPSGTGTPIPAPVPLPLGLWMLISGLLGLIMLRRAQH